MSHKYIFQCDICDQDFDTEAQLRRHEELKHQSGHDWTFGEVHTMPEWEELKRRKQRSSQVFRYEYI